MIKTLMTFSVTAATTLLVGAGTARAADGPPAAFGQAGQLSLGSDLNLVSSSSLLSLTGSSGAGVAGLLLPATMLSVEGSSTSNNGGSTFGFSFAPAADYFVIDNLSLGVELLVGYATASPGSQPGSSTSPPSTNVTSYGIAPRVGYNIPIGDSFSFWPKVFFEHAGYSVGGAGTGYGNIQLLGLYAPFLYHPSPHFYLGVGPNILTELGANIDGTGATGKLTAYGAFASIGGWFKLGGG